MSKRDIIVEVMHRLGLEIQENGLLTFAVLEEIWDDGYAEGVKESEK